MRAPENTDPLTGILLFTSISITFFALFLQDLQFLIFALPVIYGLIVANSRHRADIDENIKSIGITSSNIKEALPIGLTAGILMFIIGNIIISLAGKNVASTIPTFAISLSGASFIPAQMYLATNIFLQWSVVSASEEVGFRFLAPFIYNSFFKNSIIAMILATATWVLIHVPTYTMQGVSTSMYLVLFLIGIMCIALIYYTGSLITSWVAHATFNSLVLIIGGMLNIYVYIMLTVIGIIIFLLYLSGGEHRGKTQSEFNL